MASKSKGIRQSGKNKGTLKKGFKYNKNGRVVKAKGQTTLSQHSKPKGTRVIKRSKSQRGSSDTPRDRQRTAMSPGRRRTASGSDYTENRRNRSDMNKKRRL